MLSCALRDRRRALGRPDSPRRRGSGGLGPRHASCCAASSIFGGEHIYTNWIHGAPHRQGGLAQLRRGVYATDLGMLGAPLGAQRWPTSGPRSARRSTARRGARPAPRACSRAGREDWQGDEAEIARRRSASSGCSRPIIALTYAFGYTFFAFDQVMSTLADLVLEHLRLVLHLGRLPERRRGHGADLRAAPQRAGLGGRDHAARACTTSAR